MALKYLKFRYIINLEQSFSKNLIPGGPNFRKEISIIWGVIVVYLLIIFLIKG